jgi:hypothetical protein
MLEFDLRPSVDCHVDDLTLSCLQVIGYACKVFRVLFNCHGAICTTLFLPIVGDFLPLY